MDRIPQIKLDRTKEIESRAKLQDVIQRAQAVRPINAGTDILQEPFSGAIKL